MDIRILAKLVAARVGQDPVDLDEVLEALGVEISWLEKIKLVQSLEGIEAVYHAISGKIILKRANVARA
ncbi:hypothetical protein [Pyrobaculum aerophilum]|uniref:Uncharacterized protein n=2 Tax=Pyrobaculum aerophilum TaxID=13773 RepID=Q8ZSW3_PYRAE|nr:MULTISPECIES: hypothetical protein [Pyrobaculum]AAL65000.1 hypothetical protein PAE3558 [Pyrobaculum aerophilum str. IM2]MCX8137972.1 hypothetical protein [Pyrobaculum aerophilum]HII47854.1 hypothetical protein [Pyrobaculum aerophilum]